MSAEKRLTIDDVVREVHRTAKDKGWHDEPRTLVEELCLVHTEISEAVEEIRAGHLPTETYYEIVGGFKKPCGVASELMDAVIRLFDICAKYGIPAEQSLREKMEYNKTRPYRHGGKKM